jgi:uncharacterized membrane protein
MMESKKSQYDTNPLDPDVERKADEDWGATRREPSTQPVRGVTSDVGTSSADGRKNVYSEAPTRRYDAQAESAYPSVFVPPPYAPPVKNQQNPYVPNPYANLSSPPSSRPVLGFGIPEKWAVMLPYAPFYIGLVVSLIELFIVPRRETKVRFHASQALSLHIGILIVQTIFSVISTITGSSIGGVLFRVAALAFLIISMIKVGRGDSHRISPLAEPAQWFNDHIEPRIQR